MAVAEVFRSTRDRHFEAAVEKLRVGVQAMAAWIHESDGEVLGEGLIQIREAGIDPLEAVFATGVRRFDKSGEYKADGALSLAAWLRWKCKLSGGAAMERVEIARQLEKLPQTGAAFANGDVGYQHVAVLARAAEHVGAAAVRKEEGKLLQAAQTMDPGQFMTVAKNFEHRVDAAGALAEANNAYQRRYFHISGQSELEHELNHASRTLPASIRRALEARDRHCVFPGCTRPLTWCDGHHLVWWTRGGATALPNLALLCRPHHRMVHEEGWILQRTKDGHWKAKPPLHQVPANARSA